MTCDELRELFLAFPGVVEAPSYGTPGFRVRKKLLSRMHQSEDAVVLKVRNLDHQEALLAARPRVFYLTPHYEGTPWILGRLSTLREADAREIFEQAWRACASRALVREYDGLA